MPQNNNDIVSIQSRGTKPPWRYHVAMVNRGHAPTVLPQGAEAAVAAAYALGRAWAMRVRQYGAQHSTSSTGREVTWAGRARVARVQ